MSAQQDAAAALQDTMAEQDAVAALQHQLCSSGLLGSSVGGRSSYQVGLDAVVGANDASLLELGDLLVGVAQTLEDLDVVLAQVGGALVVGLVVGEAEGQADGLEGTASLILIDGDGRGLRARPSRQASW